MRLVVATFMLACQGTMTTDSVTLEVRTTKSAYQVGEPVDVRLGIFNDTRARVTLRFSSGQRFDLYVLSATQDTVFRWSARQGFIQALGVEVIEPDARLEFLGTIDVALPAGAYTVVGLVTSTTHPLESRATFRVG